MTMTPARRAEMIRAWAKHITALEAAHADLHRLTLASPESPLMDAGLRIAEAYTHSTSELIGDGNEWLTWFWLENNMGSKGLAAGFDPDIVPVRTIDQLVEIIEQEQP